jgi:hypothetical protein
MLDIDKIIDWFRLGITIFVLIYVLIKLIKLLQYYKYI